MIRKHVYIYSIVFVGILLISSIFIFVNLNVTSLKTRQNSLTQSTPPPIPVIQLSPTLPQTSVASLQSFMSHYGFSLQYPSDWQLLDQPSVTGVEIRRIDSQGLGFSISVRINDNPQRLSLLDYAENQAFTSQSGQQDVPEAITFGNLRGYKLHYLPDGLLTTAYFQTKQPNKVLYIFSGGEYDKSPQTISYYTAVINQIIDSIRLN